MFVLTTVLGAFGVLISAFAITYCLLERSLNSFISAAISVSLTVACWRNVFGSEITRSTIESPQYYKVFEEEGYAHFIFGHEVYETRDYKYLKSPDNVKILTKYVTDGKWLKNKERLGSRELIYKSEEVEKE